MRGTEDMADLHGAIEAGGTKFICAIGEPGGSLIDEHRIETSDPVSTLKAVTGYFKSATARFGAIKSLGVGSFGPLDLRRESPTYGFITSTPKRGWQRTDLAGWLERELHCPVFIDTDVNGAVLAEYRWGAARGLKNAAYVTVGTGVGVGVLCRGQPVHGLMHPEMGHIVVRRHPADMDFAGTCPFHGDCLEGLASGPAITARTGCALRDSPGTSAIWDIEADYLGQLAAMLVLCHSPERIVIGGGVMQERLYPRIQERMLSALNGYCGLKEIEAPDFLCTPGLGGRAGILGALSLSMSGH
jgi:fructokinase